MTGGMAYNDPYGIRYEPIVIPLMPNKLKCIKCLKGHASGQLVVKIDNISTKKLPAQHSLSFANITILSTKVPSGTMTQMQYPLGKKDWEELSSTPLVWISDILIPVFNEMIAVKDMQFVAPYDTVMVSSLSSHNNNNVFKAQQDPEPGLEPFTCDECNGVSKLKK